MTCPPDLIRLFSYRVTKVKTRRPYFLVMKIAAPYIADVAIDMKPIIIECGAHIRELLDEKVFSEVISLGDHIEWPKADIMLAVMGILEVSGYISNKGERWF